MAVICPTVTADNLQTYKEQLERLLPFAKRIHLDFMDGLFARRKSIPIEDAWTMRDASITWDVHLMYMRPDLYIDQVKRLQPSLVILHAEAKGDFMVVADKIHDFGSRVGVALLQKTPIETILPALEVIDHVLVFSGNLGHYGGKLEIGLLSKVTELKQHKPALEIAWDGGISDRNARELIRGGVDVLNVGGFIQLSDNPEHAYATLEAIALKE